MKSVKLLSVLVTFGSLFSLLGCRSVPNHEICVLDPANDMAYCSMIEGSDVARDVPLSELENYIARSPEDEQKLIEWARRNCKGE